MSPPNSGVAPRRSLAALAITATIVASVPLANTLMGDAGEINDYQRAEAGLHVDAVMQAGGIDAILDRMEGATATKGAYSDAPAWFCEEVGFLVGARDVRVSDAGDVVGFVVDGAVQDVLANLQEHMESRGWTCVPLGGVDGATFVKEGGRCSWALATCTQVDAATSVVFRNR